MRANHHDTIPRPPRHRAFTLLELMLVLGVLVILAVLVVPNYQDPLQQSKLPESAERFRNLLHLTRTNAMYDGLRYRIRFLNEDEELADELTPIEFNQPQIEVERDPFEYPGEYTPVLASWAQSSETFLGGIWCYDVRFGEPTFETVLAELEEQELDDEEQLKEELGLEEDDDWVLIFEPDGSSNWMTFRLVDVPREDFDDMDMEDYRQVDVIVDGRLGVVFLQRPLREDETELLLDKGHSPILRRDFLTMRPLTEDDVLEIDMTGGR